MNAHRTIQGAEIPQDTVSSRLALTVWKDLVTERCGSRARASLVQAVQSNGKHVVGGV